MFWAINSHSLQYVPSSWFAINKVISWQSWSSVHLHSYVHSTKRLTFLIFLYMNSHIANGLLSLLSKPKLPLSTVYVTYENIMISESLQKNSGGQLKFQQTIFYNMMCYRYLPVVVSVHVVCTKGDHPRLWYGTVWMQYWTIIHWVST